MREGAFFLYAWCRYCDDWMDQVDQIPNLTREQRSERKLANLETLKVKTLSACRGETQQEIPFQALQAVVKKYGIPEKLPMDLIEGMAMDARDEKYNSTEDLERYCYHVAGVVGVMMSYIMGVSDPKAFDHAKALGNAMQMTNIARDVREDREMGRVYLPAAWNGNTVTLVQKLLTLADLNYDFGNKGLKYLPLRAAFAIASASEVYRTIGKMVRARGEHAWDSRTVVPFWRKLLAVARGGIRVLRFLPVRLFHRWVPINLVEKKS